MNKVTRSDIGRFYIKIMSKTRKGRTEILHPLSNSQMFIHKRDKKQTSSNHYFSGLKRWFLLRYYKDYLRETLIRIIKGEQGLELARRFFNYKIYQLSKSK